MGEYIHLIGAEDVRSAGHQMASAADGMNRAASNFESVFSQHQRFMDDWLQRFESAIETLNEKMKGE